MLMAILGVGTVTGALAAALRAHPTARTVIGTGALLGVALIVAASVSSQLAFEIALVPVGALAVFFGSTANGHMQICSAPELRGRVMAIYSLLTLGTTVVGGPFVGWVCQNWSPRTGLALVGTATLVAASTSLAARPRPRAYAGARRRARRGHGTGGLKRASGQPRWRPKKSQTSFQPSLAASTR